MSSHPGLSPPPPTWWVTTPAPDEPIPKEGELQVHTWEPIRYDKWVHEHIALACWGNEVHRCRCKRFIGANCPGLEALCKCAKELLWGGHSVVLATLVAEAAPASPGLRSPYHPYGALLQPWCEVNTLSRDYLSRENVATLLNIPDALAAAGLVVSNLSPGSFTLYRGAWRISCVEWIAVAGGPVFDPGGYAPYLLTCDPVQGKAYAANNASVQQVSTTYAVLSCLAAVLDPGLDPTNGRDAYNCVVSCSGLVPMAKWVTLWRRFHFAWTPHAEALVGS